MREKEEECMLCLVGVVALRDFRNTLALCRDIE